MKQHKTQILAALALAFTLGIAVPNMAFAVDTNNTATQTKSTNVINDMITLYDRISNQATHNNTNISKYRTALPLIDAVDAMEKAQAGKNEADINAARATLIQEVQKASLVATGVDTMSNAELITTAKSLPNYAKFVALKNATAFARSSVKAGEKLTSAIITKSYPTEDKQIAAYNTMYNAAKAVDATAVNGLSLAVASTNNNSNTTTQPSTPDTGINDWFENGALDLGTVTLLVSVVVASVAGLGLIAKLYLKHKF